MGTDWRVMNQDTDYNCYERFTRRRRASAKGAATATTSSNGSVEDEPKKFCERARKRGVSREDVDVGFELEGGDADSATTSALAERHKRATVILARIRHEVKLGGGVEGGDGGALGVPLEGLERGGKNVDRVDAGGRRRNRQGRATAKRRQRVRRRRDRASARCHESILAPIISNRV